MWAFCNTRSDFIWKRVEIAAGTHFHSRHGTKTIPVFLWNGEETPGILNWLVGNESWSFVSEMSKTSTSVRISKLPLEEFMLIWVKTIRLRFFIRIFFRPLSETSLSDKRSACSSWGSYSIWFTSKQLESVSYQKIDLKYLRKFLVNKELPCSSIC